MSVNSLSRASEVRAVHSQLLYWSIGDQEHRSP